MASFVHSFEHHGMDHIAKELCTLKWLKQPWVGSDIRANFITAYSAYLLSDDPEMSQLIFIFSIFWILLFFFVLFIYLSYIFIWYIYLFIFIHLFISFRCPPSAVRCSILQTPLTGRDPFNQNFHKFRSKTHWISLVQPEKFRKNWWTTFPGWTSRTFGWMVHTHTVLSLCLYFFKCCLLLDVVREKYSYLAFHLRVAKNLFNNFFMTWALKEFTYLL